MDAGPERVRDVQDVVDGAQALIAVAAFLKPERARKVSVALEALVQSIMNDKRASLSEDAKILLSLQRTLPEKLVRDMPSLDQDQTLERLVFMERPPPPPAPPAFVPEIHKPKAQPKPKKRAESVVEQKLPVRKRGKHDGKRKCVMNCRSFLIFSLRTTQKANGPMISCRR